MRLAALFLCTYAIILTLSPAVRERKWDVSYRWEHWIGVAVWMLCFMMAYRNINKRLPDHDPYLLPLAGLLSGWGLLTIWRLAPNFGLRQTIWLGVCLTILTIGTRLPSNLLFFRRYKYILLTTGILLLALTFIIGTHPNGLEPNLWLGLFGVYVQPSELLKLLFIIYLAGYLSEHILLTDHLLTLITPTLIITGLALALLVIQRDLGTASIFVFLYATQIFVASDRRRIILTGLLFVLMASFIGYYMFDVIRLRVEAWINPWGDPSGRSYQIVQSLIAIAAGGVFGRGPGMGSPGLVPVAQSDFIFSAICEETGILGSTALILLICFLAIRGFKIALNASNQFLRLLAIGLSTYLIGQSILIIGGNIRLLPLTGVTLPFISYGGSSLLVSFIALLLLLHISHHPTKEPAPLVRTRPYSILAAIIMLCIITLVSLDIWWSVIRGQQLQYRTDNVRQAIADRYVPRGSILDRNDTPLTETIGSSGNYSVQYNDIAYNNVVGYTHSVYGMAGIQEAMDPYLRGTEGNPSSLIWWDHILYGQPPPGLDVRTTIDANLQKLSNSLLGGHRGGIVLANAQSGEILVMASQPTFDANKLDTDWEKLVNDKSAPLINRDTQTLYPAGVAIGPFLLAATNTNPGSILPEDQLEVTAEQGLLNCAQPESNPATMGNAVSAGCPGATIILSRQRGNAYTLQTLIDLGLYSQPTFPLAASWIAPPESLSNLKEAITGSDTIMASPLQMSMAASAISAGGTLPVPRLISSVHTPNQGWVILPIEAESKSVLDKARASKTANALAVKDMPFWQAISHSITKTHGKVTWYLGGTLDTFQGTPLAICIVLEEDNPTLAMEIGQKILQAAILP